MASFIKTLRIWIPIAFLTFCFCGLVYLAVQQTYRRSANDPQIQMAEDAAAALSTGAAPSTVVPMERIDIATSLAPYIVVYDKTGLPITGNGSLGNALPSLPAGVFEATQNYGEDRITWQPAPGIRSAIVITRINGGDGGFVMAGRSLRETEDNESALLLSVGAVLLFTLVGSFLLVAAGVAWFRR